MKSGLGDRNNLPGLRSKRCWCDGLNEVRSWRPEQYEDRLLRSCSTMRVSMKSGLGDRNNHAELTPGSRPADQSQ